MRLLCWLHDHPRFKRLVIYSEDDGAYLFPYESEQDSNACGDWWFESVKDAQEAATSET